MNKFSNMLRISGYNARYRFNIIRGAILRMKEVRRKVAEGEWVCQYRDREAIAEAKSKKGGDAASTWFLKGTTTSTVTCAATPGSQLQQGIKEALKLCSQADGGTMLVVEDGGVPATLGIKSRDPFRSEGCTFRDPNCMVDIKNDCSKQDQIYIVTCNGCKESVNQQEVGWSNKRKTDPGGEGHPNYVGMTGTSLHTKGNVPPKGCKSWEPRKYHGQTHQG